MSERESYIEELWVQILIIISNTLILKYKYKKINSLRII